MAHMMSRSIARDRRRAGFILLVLRGTKPTDSGDFRIKTIQSPIPY